VHHDFEFLNLGARVSPIDVNAVVTTLVKTARRAFLGGTYGGLG
jgi:hypothetical protein